MEPLTIGFIGLGLFLILVLAGLPIAFAALLVAIGGMIFLQGFEPVMKFTGYMPFAITCNYPISVMPLYIFMGYLAFHAGITEEFYWTARQWLGHLPGGLAIATVVGAAGFGACSGSSLAAATVFGKIAVPELRRHGYDPKLATGCVAASGTISVMIPPSIILIIYGILAEQSIAFLLIAGILPGLLEAVSYAIYVGARLRLNPRLGPPLPAASWKERFLAIKGIWGISLLVLLVIGGMFVGWFTPTESGAIGALGALLIGLISRRLTWPKFREALMDTVRTSSMLFIILVGILILMRFLAFSGVTIAITDSIAALPFGPMVTLIAILVVGIIYGFFLSAIGLLMLVVPIFLPVMTDMGIDPIVFGILLVRVIEIGQITPPVGIVVYAVKAVVPDVPMQDIFRGVLPFVGVDFINIVLLVAFPIIITFLPGLMF